MKNNLSNYIIKLFVVLLTGTFVFVASCKKEEPEPCPCDDPYNIECPNYDSCLTKHEVNADFEMSFTNFYGEKFLVHNVVSGYIKFEALEENAEYEWTLGTETFTTKSFVRHFNVVPEATWLNVTLKVTKQPDTTCFPADDGLAFKSHNFMKSDSMCNYNVIGHYKVLFTEKRVGSVSSDSVFIELQAHNNRPGWGYCEGFRMIEYTDTDTIVLMDDTDPDPFIGGNRVGAADLNLRFDDDGFITLDWDTQTIEGDVEFYQEKFIKFKGRKID
jgi:hypothetical protein